MHCVACGRQLAGNDFRAFQTLGDCHPVCPDCHRFRQRQPSAGHSTLMRRLFAAGRSISRCHCCGAESELEVHFIRPLALGGQAESRNLLLLCDACHDKAHLPGARIKGSAIEIPGNAAE